MGRTLKSLYRERRTMKNIVLLSLLTLAILQPLAEAQRVCEAGWTEFGGKCYKYFAETKTWGDAQDQCVQNGAELVSIHSAEENVFVAGLSSGPKLWLGGKRDCSDCDLYWTDGTPWDFQTWIPNNPSKDGVCFGIFIL